MRHLVRGLSALFCVLVLICAGITRALAEAATDAAEEANDALQQRDFTKAYKLLRPVAEAGDPWAQYVYGHLILAGVGGQSDPAEACKWFQKSAEQSYAPAQGSFGECYYRGHGVPKDTTKAVEWYRKSAEQGDAGGENNLGSMYAQGEGVPADGKEAVRWLERSALHGNPQAMYNLGKIYLQGSAGLAKDTKLAFLWGLLANVKGYEKAYVVWRAAEDELTIRQLYEAKSEARSWAELHPDAMKEMPIFKPPG